MYWGKFYHIHKFISWLTVVPRAQHIFYCCIVVFVGTILATVRTCKQDILFHLEQLWKESELRLITSEVGLFCLIQVLLNNVLISDADTFTVTSSGLQTGRPGLSPTFSHLGTMSSGEAEAVVTLGFWQLAVAAAAWASFKADVDMVVLSVRGAWTRLPVGTPRRWLLLFPSRTWVVAVVVVVLAGWAVPLLVLVAELLVVVVQGWSEAGVGVEVGGAGAAGEGDAVLERCKPL